MVVSHVCWVLLFGFLLGVVVHWIHFGLVGLIWCTLLAGVPRSTSRTPHGLFSTSVGFRCLGSFWVWLYIGSILAGLGLSGARCSVAFPEKPVGCPWVVSYVCWFSLFGFLLGVAVHWIHFGLVGFIWCALLAGVPRSPSRCPPGLFPMFVGFVVCLGSCWVWLYIGSFWLCWVYLVRAARWLSQINQ